jgi:hypothetical protein
MLPAPGHYDVVLKNEASSIKTELMVVDSSGGLSLKCTGEIPFSLKGRLSIVWLDRIVKNSIKTYEDKTLIS